MSDLVFAHQVTKRVLELRLLNEQIVLPAIPQRCGDLSKSLPLMLSCRTLCEVLKSARSAHRAAGSIAAQEGHLICMVANPSHDGRCCQLPFGPARRIVVSARRAESFTAREQVTLQMLGRTDSFDSSWS